MIKLMKLPVIMCAILLLVSCSSDLKFPPATPSPVMIRIQGNGGYVSSMDLNPDTVKTAVATQIANGQAALRLHLTNKGAKALYTITSSNINNPLQIYWKDHIINQDKIQSPLGGSVMVVVFALPDSTPDEIHGIINSIRYSPK